MAWLSSSAALKADGQGAELVADGDSWALVVEGAVLVDRVDLVDLAAFVVGRARGRRQ
jgi:uncharacterized NAD-dependent epimerase/dehydratase family protein